MMSRASAVAAAFAWGVLVGVPFESRLASQESASPDPSGEVWVDPVDLEQRDLFRGPSFSGSPPAEHGSFAFVEKDTTGRSPGYDVRDDAGVVWSVKLGHEAQSEVVSSRLLWAIGFHQPPTYYVNAWTLTGTPEAGPQAAGRFRPEVDEWKDVGDWEWAEYPHAATAANAGLLVAQMMINNWDLKNSNNKVIERPHRSPSRLYIVRDLGASLGSNEQAKWLRWTQLRVAQGTKNDVEGFEESGFIDGIDEDGYVKFSYSGPNKPLVSRITPAHVRWTSQLMARLSDQQWHDAFRAGGYTPEDAARYIAKFKARIAVGLALDKTGATRWASLVGAQPLADPFQTIARNVPPYMRQ
jgi:hypothetical protein